MQCLCESRHSLPAEEPTDWMRALKQALSTPTALANRNMQTLVFVIQHLRVLLAISVPLLATLQAEDN